jgi:hypothetical protein
VGSWHKWPTRPSGPLACHLRYVIGHSAINVPILRERGDLDLMIRFRLRQCTLTETLVPLQKVISHRKGDAVSSSQRTRTVPLSSGIHVKHLDVRQCLQYHIVLSYSYSERVLIVTTVTETSTWRAYDCRLRLEAGL